MFVCAILLSASIGCGGGSSGSDSDSGDLGTQIDQMGRAAINTALVMTFADDATRGAAEDSYNATANADRSSFQGTMAGQLAVYDALVGECGDNPVTNRASANPADGLATGPDRYAFVASVFADDALFVNTNSGGAEAGQCGQYLSVELGVLGITGLEADCGGRTPNYDTIDATYSAVAIGQVTGVTDGIGSAQAVASTTEFPFLAAPF